MQQQVQTKLHQKVFLVCYVRLESTNEYYLLRLCAVHFQVIILSPGLNVHQSVRFHKLAADRPTIT